MASGEEGKLQRKIITDLENKGWLVNKIIRCSRSGWPDVEAYKKMNVILMEIKALGKKPDPLQVYLHKQLNKHGFTVHVIDSWEQYLNLNIS